MEIISIVSTVVTVIVGLLGVFGVSKYFELRAASKAKLEEQAQLDQAAATKAQRLSELKQVIQNELKYIVSDLNDIREDLKSVHATDTLLRESLQALLRDRLYQLSTKCLTDGYATQEQKINFENMYEKYHALGANGVMDTIREQFLDLPLKTND